MLYLEGSRGGNCKNLWCIIARTALRRWFGAYEGPVAARRNVNGAIRLLNEERSREGLDNFAIHVDCIPHTQVWLLSSRPYHRAFPATRKRAGSIEHPPVRCARVGASERAV